MIDRQAIMSRALRHGFTLRQQPGGKMDLNDYVYAFAREVFEAGRLAGAAPSPCQGHARQQDSDEVLRLKDILFRSLLDITGDDWREDASKAIEGCSPHQVPDESMGLRDCHSIRIKNHDPDPCSYRMQTTDPGCTGCADRDEDQSTEAGG